jgi:3-oxoacyl-[acyl-carrier protein] reductase
MTPPNQKRVVIVTGASRGIGRQIALRFGKAGDRIVVNFLSREQDAAAVSREIVQQGGEAVPVRADVRIASDVDALICGAAERWGSVDVLINNAGIAKDGLLLRMPERDWDDVIACNLSGPYHCIRAASEIMAKQRRGHIVSIASIVGVQGREGQANYSASKAGLIGLTKACARELGPLNINVNAVLPGYIPTDMGNAISSSVHERILKENALGRASDPTEVAEFIYRLTLMSNVSGQVFNLDSRIL